MLLYCTRFSFFHPPFVGLDCVWLQRSARMFAQSLWEPPCREECLKGHGEGLSVCLCVYAGRGGDICANVSSCVHSLVVTAGFPGWRRGKPSGWTNKQAASKGSYLPGQKHTGPLRYRKGGGEYVISVFLANCPVLVERKCSGYISFHHGMPPTVIKKRCWA